MKSDIKKTLEFKNKNWLKAIVMGGILFLPFGKALDAAVEGGALLKGATLSDDSAVIPEQSATSKAIKWSSTDLDPSVFEFDSANPTRLKVKAAGDYFLAFSSPVIEAVKAGSNRSQVHFFVKKNGGSTPIPHANARSTYIRHDSDHTESSGHMHVLLPSLSANDYIEIFAKSFDTANNTVRIGIASLFLEKIASSRTIFSATGTRTVAGTNLNPDTASPLQWTQDVADSGFTHSNSSSSHNITLDSSGKYLVFIDMPISSSVQRASPQIIPKIGGVQVTGGFAAQGYIRGLESTTKSSVHWVGLVQTATANQVLTFDVGKRAAGGTVTVPTNEKASVFIEKLANANNLFSARATQLSTGDNWNVAGEVKWATQETIDTAKFTHSGTSNAHQVTVDTDGDYLLLYSDALTASASRANPKMVVRVNGNDILGTEVASHYIRNASGHNHSSGSLVTVLNGLKSNDVISIGVSTEAASGTVNDHFPGRLVLIKKPTLPAPVITIAQTSGTSPISASVTFKQDGSNVSVTGFTAADITANDATISNFSGSGHTYTFNVVPTTYPAIINVTIPAGAATTGSGSQTGTGTALTQFRDLVTDDGSLVLYLPFDEGTGTVTKDRSSSGKNGILGGNPTWVAGKRGYALEFDGTGDQVDVNNFKGVLGNGPITVALWFKSTYNNASAQQSFVSWGVNGGGTRYTLNFDGAKIRLDNGGGAATTTATYADGFWHHIVAIKPNNGNIGNVVHYVDGVVSAHGGSGGSTFNISESSNFSIGADRTGANRINFVGTIDDVRLYAKELNSTAVAALYASGDGEGYYTPTIPTLTVDQYANASPVPVSVTFKRGGSNLPVAGFTSSDISVNGGTVSNFSSSGGGGHTYTFNVTPTTFPSTVTVTIPKGAAAGGGGVYENDVVSKSFFASFPISFAPESMEGVEMWYDASDLNADGTTDTGYSAGSAVNSWSDKSGNGYHLTKQGDPTWASQNGLGVVNFDGDDSFYSANEWGGKREFTILSIARYTHSTNNFRLIADRTSNNWIFGFHSGRMHTWHFGGWLTQVDNGKDTKFHLHSASMTNTDKGNTFFDGSRVGYVNGNGATGSYLPRQIQFGGWQTNSEYSKGEVAEFIAFDRVLGESERLAVEGYLANKWGIAHQLPVDHFNRDTMAGIGSGISAEITAASPTQAYPIPVTVTFKKNGANHSVSNFANDFTTSFKPSEINGLELWLDASDGSSILHSSNDVSAWNDKSGNGLQGLQATSSKRPSVVANGQNGLSTIRFDGTDDFIQVRTLRINQAYTIYSVAKTTAGSARDYLFDGVTTNSARSLIALRNSGTVQFWAGNWANTSITSPTGFFTLSAVFDNTSSLLSLNGTTVTGKNTGSYSLTNGINLGTNYNTNNDFLEGDIAEFIIVDGVASTSDRQKVEGYLAHKWGTTAALASSHPYKSSQPTSVGVSSDDFVVEGATVSNVAGSGASYTMNLTPLTNPARIKIKVGEGAAQSSSTGERNRRSTKEILFRPPVLKESNLALYFPLDEAENATTVQDWGPHGLVGTVSGNPARFPGRVGSAFRFPQSAGLGISVPHHRSMRMGSNGAYTHNVWIRMEVGTQQWGTVAGREGGIGRQYFFYLGNNNNANGGFIHHRYMQGSNWNSGPPDAYRVSPLAWTMVTVMNQGNPGVAKTYLNGAPIQTGTITDTIRVEQTTPYKIGNANLKASVQNARLYNVAFTDAEVLALYNAVDSESGAVVINVDNVVPFNAGVASITQPTYSVTVSAFEPTWSASGLPTGLSIDASTGAITGTASGTPANTGTDHTVDLMATNGYGKTTRSVIMKAYPMPSSITDGGAIDLGMYGATLTGSFADVTGTECKVHFFVDTADRGDSNVSAWAQHFILENQTPGSFSRVLSGLTFNTTYRYRWPYPMQEGL